MMREDPRGTETKIIHEFVDFTDLQVLEIGCGDGRVTWRYAAKAAGVVGIDPDEGDIAAAVEARPEELKERVEFIAQELEDYQPPKGYPGFDVAILSWSL